MKRIIWMFVMFLFACFHSIAQVSAQRILTDSINRVQQKKGISLHVKSLAVGTAFTTYGFLRPYSKEIGKIDQYTRYEIMEDHAHFSTHADDYLQWVPSISAMALQAAGVKTTHSFKQQMAREGVSIIVMAALIYPLKNLTAQWRPDNSAPNSFPSGHTTNAFRGAEIMHQELKYTHPIWSYSGYAVAAATGALRVYNNRHWFSDVVTGAGLGILSTQLTYWVFDKVKRKRK